MMSSAWTPTHHPLNSGKLSGAPRKAGKQIALLITPQA